MIRQATISDAAAILQIRAASINALTRSHYSPAEVEDWCGTRTPEMYHAPIEQKIVLLDEQDDEPVAFGQLDPVTSIVDALYVHPSWARRGIGVNLLRALAEIAVERGLSELTLEASLNAVEFYRRAGYVCVDEVAHELGQGGPRSTVSMRHQLRV